MNKQLNPWDYYVMYWKRAFDINGRSTRSEFWHPMWINIVLNFVISFLSMGVGSSIFLLAIMIPSFTVMVRRFHDVNQTMVLPIVLNVFGFLYGLAMIPVIFTVMSAQSEDADSLSAAGGFAFMIFGGLILINIILYIVALISLVKDSDMHVNNYGPCPKINHNATYPPQYAGEFSHSGKYDHVQNSEDARNDRPRIDPPHHTVG